MIFRPKIFISSTFKENIKLRENIRKYFYSTGAEPLLYENELTPSVLPMTYRHNLLDADFMILIVKEDYGTETDLGISGIHEEYKIAFNNKIPLHVYLKKGNVDDNPLIKELKKDGISYYYFDSDKDLMARLKETTFTIAKEIMQNHIDKSKLPDETIKKMAGKVDYNRAMQVISIIESMSEAVKINEVDWISSDIFTECLERIIYEFSSNHHHFVNWKLDEQLNNMLKIASNYISHSVLDFTSTGAYRNCNISVLGDVQVHFLSYNKNTEWEQKNYMNELKQFFEEYEKFKNMVQCMRIEIDLI